jgi:hypothetical protein
MKEIIFISPPHPGKAVFGVTAPEEFPDDIINNRTPVAKILPVPSGIYALEFVVVGVDDLIERGLGGALRSIKVRGKGTIRWA